MKTLLVSTSTSTDSINRRVVNFLARSYEFEVLDCAGFADIPYISSDIEVHPSVTPEQVHYVCGVVKKYERIVFFCPEYNGYLSGFAKNLFDWMWHCSSDLFKEKEVFVVSVSRTKRTERTMEAPVTYLFSLFEPKSFQFVNFNEFDEEEMKGSTKKMLKFLLPE